MMKFNALKTDYTSLKKKLEVIKVKLEDRAKEVEKEVAQDILKKAKKDAPHDTGALKRSAYMKKKEKGYEVGFSADYALIVHEQPQSSRKNGKRHFLSNASKEIAGNECKKIKERFEEGR